MDTIRDTGYRDELARLTPNLRRFARALVRNHNSDASDELVQATLVRALAADHARRGTRLVIWLTSVLAGLHREQVRDVTAEQKLRSGGGDASTFQGHQPWSPRPSQERRDPALLSRIPLEYREALLLVVLENMTYAQAADSLGLSVNTVATRVARAREYLSDAQAKTTAGASPRSSTGKLTRVAAPYLRVVK